MEHPILFNGKMVRAILNGEKTQTRRIIKAFGSGDEFVRMDGNITIFRDKMLDIVNPAGAPYLMGIKCQYGQPGDYLWVRESLRRYKRLEFLEDNIFYSVPEYYTDSVETTNKKWTAQYMADNTPVPYVEGAKEGWCGVALWQWKNTALPSIHMPRWASRITLQITDIDVKQVRSVAEENQKDWDFDYGKTRFSWANNPWVYIIDFKRV